MKTLCLFYLVPVAVFLFFTAQPAQSAEDMRAQQVEARTTLHSLKAKAVAEEETARQEAAGSREKIAGDRTLLDQEVRRIEAEVAVLEKAVAALETENKTLETQEAALVAKLTATDSMVRELVGVIRSHAKDLQTLVIGSLQTALSGDETALLEAIAGQTRFPGMTEIAKMNEVLRRQLHDGGAVRLTKGPIVDRSGNTVDADILVLGNFTAAYRLGEEVGFLNYSTTGRKLFALSRLPGGSDAKQLRHYMDGKDEAVPIDISRGAALSQLVHTPSFWQQVESGGPLVWPILAIFIIAIFLILERVAFLFSGRIDADGLTGRITAMATTHDWQACKEECRRLIAKPLSRVLAAGLECCHLGREMMENALQEAILKEIPPLERFLSTLGMLAAIAPLLGLLGTVTGMIDTFFVITQHGTGDPRLMSDGISVALVTTMFGLSVAIPIMLIHTLLSRAVDNRIALMEEKAVALINVVERSQESHGRP
ncbi:MAG: MotA/TolQ/ExbB proton channel family protein [Pseudomonadota bacterium]